MIFLPLVALLVGAVLAYLVKIGPIRGEFGQYLAVGCLAGLDSVCGGFRSGLEGKFRNDVFVTGFVANVLIAFFLAWLGDQIYLNLFLAVALVLATRIYTNLSIVRRIALTAYTDWQERRRLQALAQSANPENPA